MHRIAALFPAIFALGACAAHSALTPPDYHIGQLGRKAHVDGITIRPDRVIEDSRCPRTVQCFWAGRVVVRATVTGGRWSRQVDLIPGEPVPIADGALTLRSVTPDRVTDRPIRPRDYRFTFDFAGGL